MFDHVELWEDVLVEKLDELQAPELDYVLRDEPEYRVYSDSCLFFERTLVTDNMLEVLEGVVDALEGRGPRIFLLYSFFGGGKTHTLLTVYHAFRAPKCLLSAIEWSSSTHPGDSIAFRERGRRLVERLKSLGDIRVVVISGKFERLFPDPSHPVTVNGSTVKTLWGYLAALLGRYEVVKSDDESVRAPAVDRLEALLGGAKTLILMDEVVERLAVLLQSGSELDRRYAMQVVSFIDNLFQAATRVNTAIVFTLPGEQRGERLVLEGRYRVSAVEQAASSIARAARRVGAVMLEPVGSGEFWRIIQRRLFRRIDFEYAERLAAELRSIYESERSVFGGDTSYAEQIRRTYPLHPGFVEALRLIVERNERLQKTRDALKIARRVARRLYSLWREGRLAEDMLMAWHLDPRDPSLSMILYGFDQYKIVVDADLVDNIKRLSRELGERSELASLIATTIFVLTYTFESPRALPSFPDKARIARLVYDPSLFNARRWIPSDIPDVLEALRRRLYYLWSDGERYWFWHIANINRIVEQKARQLVSQRKYELLKEIVAGEEYLRGLVSRRLARSGRLGERAPRKLIEWFDVFDVPSLEDVPDNEKYKLVVALEPPPEGFERLVTHIGKGGREAPRQYRNTVVVLTPGNPEALEEEIVELYSIVKAAEEAERELNTLLQGLRDVSSEMRNLIRRAQLALLRDIREAALSRLYETLLNGFDRIYYPAGLSGPMEVRVEYVDASRLGVAAMSLVEKVESSLENIGKAVFDASFEYIASKLEEAGYGLGEPRSVKELCSAFKLHPGLPMMPCSAVIDALLRGHRDGLLVVERVEGGSRRLYWGRLMLGECGSGKPLTADRLDEDDIVYAADPDRGSREAAKRLLEYLRGVEGVEEKGDVIVERRVLVELGDQVVSLERLLEAVGAEPSIVFSARYCIVERVRKPGVRVKASHKDVVVEEGGSAEVGLVVEPVGGVEPGRIELRVEAGEGVEAVLSGDGRLVLRGKKPGEYTVVVRAIPERGEPDEAVLRVVVKGLEEEVDCSELDRVSGRVTRIRLEGGWGMASFVARQLADVLHGASARGSLSVRGVELRINEPVDVGVAVEIMYKLASELRDLLEVAEDEIKAELEIDLGGGEVDAGMLALMTRQPGPGGLVCRARVRRS